MGELFRPLEDLTLPPQQDPNLLEGLAKEQARLFPLRWRDNPAAAREAQAFP